MGDPLARLFPYRNGAAHVHVEAAAYTQLGDLDTLVHDLEELDRDALLLPPQQQDDWLIGKAKVAQRDAGCGLLQANDEVSVLLAVAEPREEIL